MVATLSALPNEILSLVTNHLDRPKDLLHLSLSSRRLYDFSQLDGWKALLKGRFGLKGLDSDARTAVHGLTTLYRNWDRKAFVARYLDPAPDTTDMSTWENLKWRGPQGQTMGYQPSIDSYEDVFGSWTERREVLAWSAGTQIAMRVKETGSKVARDRTGHQDLDTDSGLPGQFDNFNHKSLWYTYKIPQSSEGRDDITALKILRPHQTDDDSETLVFGTASGHLTLLNVSPGRKVTSEQMCKTDHRAVGSLSISFDADPLMAAILGETTLALYPVKRDHLNGEGIEPLSQVTPTTHARNGRIWSCSFISKDQVALGRGPSYVPIDVYEITPSGFSALPLRTFDFGTSFRRDAGTHSGVKYATSVYPVLPLPTNAQGGSEQSQVFLSGGYDGIIRLHDMRSPHSFETFFWDVTNDSSIYSLALQGSERVVAGMARHSMLKVFDLRLSGSHAYHTIRLSAQQPPKSKAKSFSFESIVFGEDTKTITSISGGWNLYLNPRNPDRHRVRTPHARPHRTTEDSPIYSLSIPSPMSPNIYAGREGSITSLTFLSVADPHPDPLLSSAIQRFPDTNAIDIKSSYDPSDDVMNLGMYEQGDEQHLGMQLMIQDSVGMGVVKSAEQRNEGRFRGLDERWKDPSEDRWERGQEPPQNRRGGGRGRGGRGGRGRGRGR
ncbi:hypothetical protein BDV95DRAFT_611258 [Massariosphaeria phaeospora]|uniref:F-box domain-containing protein n=1 Tax=Massariosphaeria phaeospora TaxID=100035 RepID=A0A7C8I4K6_9PLEO|nr:hypothetical protein BDV95DRAFT_611258 [Massariosphaeria phaeospora]